MKSLGRYAKFLLCIAFSVNCSDAHASMWDWLTLYPVNIEAILKGRTGYLRDSGSQGIFDYQFSGGVGVRQGGYILDPAIANFSLSIEPSYLWGKFDTADNPQKTTGHGLNYNINLDLLHGTPKPFSYNFSTMRGDYFNDASLGGRYESKVGATTLGMDWRNPAFPMKLRLTERKYKQIFTSGFNGVISNRDEVVRTLSLTGHSSKLSMTALHLDLNDLIPNRNLDYTQDSVYLAHQYPWGTGSNLRTILDYVNRRGNNANERLLFNSTAGINHPENFSSQTSYSFSTTSATYRTTTNSGRFNLRHLLYSNLSTVGDLFGSVTNSDRVDVKRWRTALGTNYSKGNLFGVGVNAGLGLSYSVIDRDSKQNSPEEIIDESHIVTLGGAVILDRRFIINTTIIVTDSDGALIYADGIDYIVVDLPEDLTQIQVLPGGRINTGDTILVSYQYESLPTGKYATTSTNYSLSISKGWMRFSHIYQSIDQKLLSGYGESFLSPSRNTTTTLDFNWNMSNFEAFVGAERRYSHFNDFSTTVYTFRQQLSWPWFDNTQWGLSFVQSFSESAIQNTDLYSLDLSISWNPVGSLMLRPRLGAWMRTDKYNNSQDNTRDDKFITAGFTLRWSYRKVSLSLAYNHNQRYIDSSQSNGEKTTFDDRLNFTLVRRF